MKNSVKFSLPPSIGNASRKTKKKIPKTSRIAPSPEPDQPFDGRFCAIQQNLQQGIGPLPQVGTCMYPWSAAALRRMPSCRGLIIHGSKVNRDCRLQGGSQFYESDQFLFRGGTR